MIKEQLFVTKKDLVIKLLKKIRHLNWGESAYVHERTSYRFVIRAWRGRSWFVK